MPIYEYECKSCGNRFDQIQKLSDEPLKTCPECHKDCLEKCISLPSFQLKGTGWYETDFKNKSNTKKDANKTQNAPKDVAGGGEK
jgi:putative FmdB family regulatory protein